MKIILTEEARGDVLRAAVYYGRIRNRHGRTFAEAFEDAAKKIPENPGRGTMFGDLFRRVRLDRFPFGILFTLNDHAVLIVAVMHLRRHPSEWLKRLPD